MLTETELRNVKPLRKPRKLSDGGGLYLLIQPNGGRYWRYNYRFEGKQKTVALGIYPVVSLDKARERHKEAKRQLADGIDPIDPEASTGETSLRGHLNDGAGCLTRGEHLQLALRGGNAIPWLWTRVRSGVQHLKRARTATRYSEGA